MVGDWYTNPGDVGTLRYRYSQGEYYEQLELFLPDSEVQRLLNIPTDKEITVRYKDAKEKAATAGPIATSLFADAANKYGIHYKPKENDFVDYNIQRTLPHKLSQ